MKEILYDFMTSHDKKDFEIAPANSQSALIHLLGNKDVTLQEFKEIGRNILKTVADQFRTWLLFGSLLENFYHGERKDSGFSLQ